MSTCASIAAALVMAAMLVARPAADTNDAADGAKHAALRELRSPATNDASADSLASASHETDGAGRMESREQGTDSRDAFGWQRSRLPATLAVRDFEDNPNYLQLRSLVLAHGFGALPKRDTGVVANAGPPREDLPRTQRELLKEFLNSDPTGQDKRL